MSEQNQFYKPMYTYTLKKLGIDKPWLSILHTGELNFFDNEKCRELSNNWDRSTTDQGGMIAAVCMALLTKAAEVASKETSLPHKDYRDAILGLSVKPEEALSHADSDLYTRKQLGTSFNTKENHVSE